jgi:small subunit ribosomal protein S18
VINQQQSGTPTATTARRPKPAYLKTGADGNPYVDYKSVDDLRRLMTPNGKIYSRKRLGTTAREQRMVAQAIKRARYMALLPYTDATL